jgi:hypothetical protein
MILVIALQEIIARRSRLLIMPVVKVKSSSNVAASAANLPAENPGFCNRSIERLFPAASIDIVDYNFSF